MINNDNCSWKIREEFSRKPTYASYKTTDEIEFPEIISVNASGFLNYKNVLDHSISAVQKSKKNLYDSKKRKCFLEMMGQQKNSANPVSSTLAKSPNPHSIAIVDLMGKDKFKFLKQAGFMNIYTNFNKQKHNKQRTDKSKSFTLKNINHADKIREYKIKNPTICKNQNYVPLFEKTPPNKSYDNKIDKIEDIMKQCDECTLIGKNKFQVPLPKLDLVNDINKMIKKSRLRLMDLSKSEGIERDINKLNKKLLV
ncbi:hypothetical protein SteCoe_22909 [Stentor coeruleus]|uniref:Uncharacterized protein n=1 Tax=Stentor coeruleus TaxID=5963 RepID=A0A1R2BL49_9CILI|nr:hypothetical protein SteCoe_22909 [Stentor coeruleus]